MDWRSFKGIMLRNKLSAVFQIFLTFVCVSGLIPSNKTNISCTDRPCYLPQQCEEETGQNATCSCGVYFTGDRCDVIRLNQIPDWNITTNDVTFTWKEPINLQNFSAAVYKKYVNRPEGTLIYYNISNGEHKNLTFGGLHYGTVYVVCVVTSEEIQRMRSDSDLFVVTLNKDRECCFSFMTSYHGKSPETIAAIAMGITVGSITGIFLLVGVIRACITNNKMQEKEDGAERSRPPSRTSSKRGSKRSIRPRTGSVKKTAWKYEGATPMGTPGNSRERLDSKELGSCASVASVASISVTVLDDSTGEQLEVDLTQVGEEGDDQAIPPAVAPIM